MIEKAKKYELFQNEEDKDIIKEYLMDIADILHSKKKAFGILKNEDGKFGNPPKFQLDPSNKKVIRDTVLKYILHRTRKTRKQRTTKSIVNKILKDNKKTIRHINNIKREILKFENSKPTKSVSKKEK